MKTAVALLIALGAIPQQAFAAEQSWEILGEFVAVKPGDPEVVVLRLADGWTINVPLDSLSATDQAEVFTQSAARTSSAMEDGVDGNAVTVRGPFGRPVRVSVPESIKDVEADAIHCRTAAEAVDVYRLFLVGDQIAPERRSAAEARLKEWVEMGDQGIVRLGDRWVPMVEARAAAEEAEKIVRNALEVMRLGNANLAEDELRKAARLNPESGRASFVMGLTYALVARNPAKVVDKAVDRAIEHFTEVIRRSPDDAAALSNLAVLEIIARRYTTVAEHFAAAIEATVDPHPLAENLAWAVKQSGIVPVVPAVGRRRSIKVLPKMPERTIDELNALYTIVTQDLKLRPPENVASPRLLGPDGTPCAAANIADVAKQMEAAGAAPCELRHALGFVIAPGHVVCPRQAIVAADGTVLGDVAVELPTDRSRRLTATVVATAADGDVALLKCEGLSVEPVPLATAIPPLPAITAVDRSGDSWLAVQPTVAHGRVVTPALEVQASGRFVHTAVVPRGSGGGPIVDDAGRLIGMVAATPRTDASGNAAGFGVPVERVWPLVKDHLPDVEAAADATTGSDGAAAERRTIAGTVVVSATRERPVNGAATPAAPR